MRGIHDKILCYLSPDAEIAIAELQDIGLDRDLAISVLEALWPEDAVYDLGE